jgi:DNA-binding MarR family transcriptional regulator
MSSPCICITLRTAARKVSAVYDEALAPLGVSVAQYALLRMIERREEVSLTELAGLADLDRSTVGRNLRVLQRRGLLRLRPGKDQREHLARLEPAARELLQACLPLWSHAQDRIKALIGADAVGVLRSVSSAL